MCTVGFDGRLPLLLNSLAGWQQGDNASPSLLRNSELDNGASNLQVESYLLNAKLLLTDEFDELELYSRVPITPVKLFLTDTEIIVARLTEDSPGSKKSLTYLRTHYIKEVDLEIDSIDSSVMCFTTRIVGRKFLYKLGSGAAGLSSWINRLFRLSRNSISPSSSTASTIDERQEQQQHQSSPLVSTIGNLGPSADHSFELQSEGTNGGKDEYSSLPDTIDETCLKNSSPLKRRKAFRNPDLDSFRSGTRSYSAPPDEQVEETTHTSLSSSLVQNGINQHLSPTNSENFFESTSRDSSLRKGKLKVSPRARKFTKALSARLMNIPISSNDDEKSVEVRRVKSLNHSSSTLPRPSKQSRNKRSKSSKSAFLSISSPSTPGTPTKPPKSPGSILKIFHRRSNISSMNLEDFLSSMEENDLSNIDIQNKPKQLKLYLQPPRQLAEELTLMDSESFRNIEQTELLNGAWTKKTKYSTSPNILRMIDSFNKLARIVCTEIVHEKTANTRAKAISNYIKIAGKLYKIHNYNSLKAVVSGLQSQAVYRLEKSWNQVPSRKRKKFEKYSNFLSEMDVADHFKNYYHNNHIKCVPYLGWLLTYTLHYQTFKKLQEDKQIVRRHHHRASSVCIPIKNPRESVCSVSMPASPILSDHDEESTIKSVIGTFSSEVLFFTKNYNIDMTIFVNESNSSSSPGTMDTPMSPREEVDFGYSLDDRFTNSIHPLAVNVIVDDIVLTPIKRNSESSSSDSSVEESLQTDSAIGLDSSTGHPSPAHTRHNGVIKPDKHKTIQFSRSVQYKFHSESMPSLCTNDDYILPIIDCDSEDDSDIEETPNGIFGNSFMGTSCSVSSSHSPSPRSPLHSPVPRSPSLLSPSMISFNVISEPSTPPRKTCHHTRLLSYRQQHRDQIVSMNSLDYCHSIVFIPVCGILFSNCPSSVDRFDTIPYPESGITFEQVLKQVKGLFDVTRASSLVKFSTPSSSTLNIPGSCVTDYNTSRHDSVISSSLPHSPTNETGPQQQRDMIQIQGSATSNHDNIFVQYQMNTLNYSCELTSRHYMRSLINNVPWLDENRCHEVSMEIEPS